jgi:ABC-type transport system involved in multi-copper enzyme maturation permease subunit
MLAGIVAFEWRYATRRLTFAVTTASSAFMGFALAATGFGPDEAHLNGPWSVTYSIGFLTLVSVFAATLVSAPALLRDTEHRMAEIVYATSVTKRDYLLGRFVGSFLAVASSFAFGLAGLVAGAFLPGHDASRLGPFDPIPYIWAFAVLALPGILLVAAFLFAVAALTRSTPATYVAGVFLYVLYLAAALFMNSPIMAGSAPRLPESMALPALLDPFGLSAFLDQTHYWTAAERNVRNVELTGRFLANRLLCVGAAALVLAFAYRRFAFRLPAGRKPLHDDGEAAAPAAGTYRPVPARGEHAWSPIVSATRIELRALFRSWPLAALLVLWIANVGIEIVQTVRSAELGTALVPTTGLLVHTIAGSLDLFGILFLVYFGAEVVWRERAVRMSEVVDATPASSALFLAAKLAALSTFLVALVVSGVGVAVLLQLANGTTTIEPLVYASLLYFSGLPLVLLAVLALLIQTLSPNRHVGLLLTLAAAAFLHRGALGGPDHPLLRYAAAPDVPWSAMSGFSPGILSFTWFMAYWTTFAALLALVTWGAWRRGTDLRLAPRLAALSRRWGRGGRLAAAILAGLFVTIGGLAFWRTNVRNRYETDFDVASWKAGYERAYGSTATLAQPVVTDLAAAVDLHPEERRVRVHGRFRLTNRTEEEIGTVWVVVRRDLSAVALSLAGSVPAEVDERFGIRRFALPRPMRPGSSLGLSFDLTLERRGPKADGEDYDVVGNGSFVMSPAVFPSVGYRRTYELVDPADRRRAGLPERPAAALPDSDFPTDLSRMTFSTTVSTPADQIAVSPGLFLGSIVEGGRRVSRFGATRPVTALFAVASGRYEVRRVRHGGLDVEVYFHPGHGRNVSWILEAATRTLDFCTARYGPYPFPQLRIAEVPSRGLRGAGFALPGVIYLAEDRAFLTDLESPGRIDLVTKRVAHEVAHQWWGHQLSPASGPGATAIVESLARYTELRVLKTRHGAAALEPVLAFETDRYLSGRTEGDEVPLVDVSRQPYLYYSKGSLAMAALAELAGEAAVDRALRDLLAEATRTGRSPTSRDLLEHLLRATPPEHRPLVEEWWTRIVLHDARVKAAHAERRPDGRYRVEVSVEAEKTETTGGVEKTLEMDEPIEVAILSAEPGSEGREATVLASAPYRVRGSTRLSILVDGLPGSVVLDPRYLLLDRNRADNARTVDVP